MSQSTGPDGAILKTLVVVTSLGMGVLASGAFAADLSIKGNIAQTLTASDNYFLSNSPSGGTAESFTAGTLDFLARTPTTNYFLDTYYSYYNFFGPGAAQTTPTWGTPAHASFSVDHTEELTTYNAAATWTRSDAALTQLAQSGVSTAHGSINTYTANAGIAQDLSRGDLLSLTVLASTTTYTDPTQFPFVDITTTAAWKHTVSSTTTLNNLVSFDWFSEDDQAKSQRLFWRLMTGVTSALSPRLTFTGNVGIAFVNSYQTNSSARATLSQFAASQFGAFVPQVGTANSIVADIALTYQLLKTTTLSLTAAQAIFPTSFGQLQKSDLVALTLTHNINSLSDLTFATQFSFIPATSGNSTFGGQSSESEFFSASVNYSYRLTHDWRTNLTYTYSQNIGVARSNTILFGLSYDFTLMGNPTAINIAQSERARERAQQSIGYVFPGVH